MSAPDKTSAKPAGRQRLIWSNSEHLFIDSRLFWILLFAGSSAVMAVTCLSLAVQYGMPEFAAGVFIFWLAFFAGLAYFTRVLASFPR